jgi:hypothetical protein
MQKAGETTGPKFKFLDGKEMPLLRAMKDDMMC